MIEQNLDELGVALGDMVGTMKGQSEVRTGLWFESVGQDVMQLL